MGVLALRALLKMELEHARQSGEVGAAPTVLAELHGVGGAGRWQEGGRLDGYGVLGGSPTGSHRDSVDPAAYNIDNTITDELGGAPASEEMEAQRVQLHQPARDPERAAPLVPRAHPAVPPLLRAARRPLHHLRRGACGEPAESRTAAAGTTLHGNVSL